MKLPFCQENERLYFDGAMGTMLQAEGLAPGESPETWNLLRPETVRRVHEAYLAAGAMILKSNTFGANRLKMEKLGLDAREVVTQGVTLAKEAVRKAGRGLVAMDIGPTGRLLAPVGDLDFEDAVALFAEMAAAGRDAGADLILIETMSDLYEAKAAVLAAKESTGLPVFATMTFDARGRLLTGCDAVTAAVTLEGLGVSALGMNCGVGPDVIPPILRRMREATSLPLIANPNAGLPRRENGKDAYDGGPEEFASAMEEAALAGASILGGCCGTTPAHIARLVETAGKLPLPAEGNPRPAAVTSGTKAVALGEDPVLVANRIAFSEEPWDPEDAADEAMAEADEGADILGLSVGTDGSAGEEAACGVIREVQSITFQPMALGISDPRVLEAAMRRYNGKPMVGPVSADEQAGAIFALVKKYGGVAVFRTGDGKGMPHSAEERLRKAEEILASAAAYGIGKRDLLIDPLEEGDIENGEKAAAAMKLIRDTLGVGISLGACGIPVTAKLLEETAECMPDAVFLDTGNEDLVDALRP